VEQENSNLLYPERTGALAQCVPESKVEELLPQLHGVHGHWAADITRKLVVGRLYWPSQLKDIEHYCQSCPNYHNHGPLPLTQGLMPVIQLQPLDMVGINFIGPISPSSATGKRYIIIAVDYVSRFLFACPVQAATSAATLSFFKEEVVKLFGWPRAVYSDNGTHFTGGIFPAELKQML
jgi:hypothetical protein